MVGCDIREGKGCYGTLIDPVHRDGVYLISGTWRSGEGLIAAGCHAYSSAWGDSTTAACRGSDGICGNWSWRNHYDFFAVNTGAVISSGPDGHRTCRRGCQHTA